MKFSNQTLFSALTDIQEFSYPQKLFWAFGLLLTGVGMLILVCVAATLF
ncbi:MAG: hypothetical protein WB623_27280 [Candidatus Sulfotelmatobacter sp.]